MGSPLAAMPLAGFTSFQGSKQLAKLCESIISQYFANWIERSRLSRLVSASAVARRVPRLRLPAPHRRRTPLRRRLLAVRYCDPVRGHKEKAGLAPAFSFAVVNLGELPGRLHRARKRRSGSRDGSDSVLRRTIWWILGGPLPSLQLRCWKLALRAFILLR